MQANGDNACVLDFVPCFSRVDCCLQQVKRLALHHELVEHAIGFQEWNPVSGISFDGKETHFHHFFFFFRSRHAYSDISDLKLGVENVGG